MSSAVDSHTAEKLISKCLCGPLVTGRTILLVTHHVDLVLHAVGWVVQLEDGSIVSQGTVKDLQAQGVLSALRHTANEDKAEAPAVDEVVTLADETIKAPADAKPIRKLVAKEEKAE